MVKIIKKIAKIFFGLGEYAPLIEDENKSFIATIDKKDLCLFEEAIKLSNEQDSLYIKNNFDSYSLHKIQEKNYNNFWKTLNTLHREQQAHVY